MLRPVPPIRFQERLTATLTRIAGTGAHLCIAGPPGCAQGTAARFLAAAEAGADRGTLVRITPPDLAAPSAGVALDRLRHFHRAASGGVLYLASLEELFADVHAVSVLSTLRDLLVDDPSVVVVVSGDRDAVSRFHALAPHAHACFVHVEVDPLTSEQIADLVVDLVAGDGLATPAGFGEAMVRLVRRVRMVGALRNGRVASMLADTVLRSAVDGTVDLATVDLSGLRLIGESPDDAYDELDELIGLADVKATVRLWMANSALSARREQLGLVAAGMGQHMVFKGPAGTAKTTVARIVGRILAETGVLSSGHLVEVQRADLIGEQVEQTARRVVEVVKRSLGGVLFIDEAYTLTAADGVRDVGREVVETLLKLMEDYREEFVVIAAGYPLEMETFLNSNPGLRSRFSRVLEFPSYSPTELLDILDFLAARRGYRVEPAVRDLFAERLALVSQYPGFGNGRHVRNLLEAAIVRQALRVTVDDSDEELATLRTVDFADPAQMRR